MKEFSALTIVAYVAYITAMVCVIFDTKIDAVILIGIAIMCQCWDNKHRINELYKKIEENNKD